MAGLCLSIRPRWSTLKTCTAVIGNKSPGEDMSLALVNNVSSLLAIHEQELTLSSSADSESSFDSWSDESSHWHPRFRDEVDARREETFSSAIRAFLLAIIINLTSYIWPALASPPSRAQASSHGRAASLNFKDEPALEVFMTKVKDRQRHQMRGGSCAVYWFESTGMEEIPSPRLEADMHPQENDLYLHRILRVPKPKVQAWRYQVGSDGMAEWVVLREGDQVMLPGLDRPRYFVITKTGKPSFVLLGTLARSYGIYCA